MKATAEICYQNFLYPLKELDASILKLQYSHYAGCISCKYSQFKIHVEAEVNFNIMRFYFNSIKYYAPPLLQVGNPHITQLGQFLERDKKFAMLFK